MTERLFAEGLLAGRVAFVTGGGTGITGGVARALAEAGARVALVSRKREHLEPAAERIRAGGAQAIAVAADVRAYEEVERAVATTVEQFGRLDIVVNGAAGNFLCRAEEMSANGFGTVVDIDLKGTFNVCRAAFAELKKHGGCVLNISATLQYLGTAMQAHAAAAKAGVDSLTRTLAIEWGGHQIRVNAIAPGPIEDTEGMKRLLAPALKDKLRHRIPVKRFGRVRDIEHAALFLCSDAASFINGAILVVDGGQWLASSKLLGPDQ
jgi:2,4-dienoyl-CoA reductase [(3E)-enoyl-CoA-producing], peroxisomal